jgi:aspartate 1-decarboxylase
MYRQMLKSKIHRGNITGADLNYIGSITIDELLMERSDLVENEKVTVLNINNGARFDTYVIAGKKGAGEICLNGAAARLAQVGDKVIILAYGSYDVKELKDHTPAVIHVDENNQIIRL